MEDAVAVAKLSQLDAGTVFAESLSSTKNCLFFRLVTTFLGIWGRMHRTMENCHPARLSASGGGTTAEPGLDGSRSLGASRVLKLETGRSRGSFLAGPLGVPFGRPPILGTDGRRPARRARRRHSAWPTTPPTGAEQAGNKGTTWHSSERPAVEASPPVPKKTPSLLTRAA